MSNVISNVLKKIRSLGILRTAEWTSYHVGISFGNYSSCLTTMVGNKAKVIKKLPSVILEKDCAKNYSFISFGFKQLLGRKFDDPLVEKEMERDTFVKKIVLGPNGNAWYESPTGSLHQPASVLANILGELRVDAESQLGKPISRAVVAIPSWFQEAQVVDAMSACYTSGITVLQIIDEVIASAISYGMCNKQEGHVFAVVDLGERTFDVSILQVVSNGRFMFKGRKSDLLLGGVEFDNVLLDFTVRQLKRLERTNVVGDQAFVNFRFAAEIVKQRLSSEAAMSIPFNKPLILGRSEFERLVSHLIERIKGHCMNCLKDAGITAKDVNEVLLVGGMARVPIVRKAVTEIFGKCPSTGVEPDEAVALGAAAAIQAGVVSDNDCLVLEGS